MKTFTKLTITALALVLASCGASDMRSTSLESQSGIRLGKDAQSGDNIATSTVQLISFGKDNSMGFCSASIIAENLILTAAHCVDPQMKMFVVFSTDAHLDNVAAFKSVARAIDGYVVNPNYNSDFQKPSQNNNDHSTPVSNDLAVVHFKGALPATFKPAQMLTNYDLLKQGTTVTVAGYGVAFDADYITAYNEYKKSYEQKYGKNVSKDAPRMEHQVQPNGPDNSGVGKLRSADVTFMGAINQGEVYLDQSKGSGTCEGDSGGPVFLAVNNQLQLFGVASRGAPRAEGSPCMRAILYTAIAPYVDFIKSAAAQLINAKATVTAPVQVKKIK